MTGNPFVALAVLVAVAGLRVRHRLRHQARMRCDGDIVHQIETLGRVGAEDAEPVDMERIRANMENVAEQLAEMLGE